MLMSICKIFIQQLVTLIRKIWVKNHLGLCIWWNGRAIIQIMAEIDSKLMGEKDQPLKEFPFHISTQ
jgi:type IV secretory pathway TrbD component